MGIHPWQIVAGAAVGIVVGAVAMALAGPDSAQQAIVQGVASFNRILHGGSPGPSRPDKASPRQAADEAAASKLRDQQARQLRADQNAATGAGSEAAEAAARKERAWAKFYKKPAQCEGNPNNDTMVECANHFIRAKRQFDEAYAAGRL